MSQMSYHNESNHSNECKPSLIISDYGNTEDLAKIMNTIKLGDHSNVMDSWILDVNRNCSHNNHCE